MAVVKGGECRERRPTRRIAGWYGHVLALAAGLALTLSGAGGTAGAQTGCAGFHGQLLFQEFQITQPIPLGGMKLELFDDFEPAGETVTSPAFTAQGHPDPQGGVFCLPVDSGTWDVEVTMAEVGGRVSVGVGDPALVAPNTGRYRPLAATFQIGPADLDSETPLAVTLGARFDGDQASERNVEYFFEVDGAPRALTAPGPQRMAEAAAVYWRSVQYLEWWERTFPPSAGFAAVPETNLPIRVYSPLVIHDTADDGKTSYTLGASTGDAHISLESRDTDYTSKIKSAWVSTSSPENAEWHELTHYTTDLDGLYDVVDDGANHEGWRNASTTDSIQEGWAMFAPAVASRELPFSVADDQYAGFGSLEGASLLAWQADPIAGGHLQREDLAVAALLWDLFDGTDGTNGPADGVSDCLSATDGCDTTPRRMIDSSGTVQAQLRDEVTLTPAYLYKTLKELAAADLLTVADLHQRLVTDGDLDPALRSVEVDINPSPTVTTLVRRLDIPFIAHGFHPCDPALAPDCPFRFSDNDRIGHTDRELDPGTGTVERRATTLQPGSAIRIENPSETVKDVTISLVEGALESTNIVPIEPGETAVVPLDLIPYDTAILGAGGALPACDEDPDALIEVVITDEDSGETLFDSCELGVFVEHSDGQAAVPHVVGDVALRYRVELVDGPGDGVVTIGPGFSFDQINARLLEEGFDPSEPTGSSLQIDGVLRLYVPALEVLAPVKIPGAVVSVDTASQTVGVAGEIILGNETLGVDLTASFDATGLQSVDVDLELAGLGSGALITGDDLVAIVEDLVGADVAPDDALPADLAVQGLAAHFRWDPTGIVFDGFGVVDVNDLRIGLMVSADVPVTGSPRFVVGARFDNATDPTADTITLEGLLGGAVGALAAELKFPEFAVVAAFPGTEPLKAEQLRPEQLAFFEPAGLPGGLDLASTLSFAADIELNALGEDVRNLFGYAPGATASLSGQLGFSFTDFAEGGFAVDNVNLNVTLPGTDGAAAGLLPEWLAFPEGATLRVSWDGDEWVVGADTRIDVTLEGDTVVTDLRGELVTDGSTLTATLEAELREAWETPFAIPWLTIDAARFELTVDVTASDLTLNAALSGSAQIADGQGGTIGTTVNLAISLEEDTPEVTAVVDIDGVSVRNILGAIGVDASAVPAEIDLVLSGTIAAGITPDEFELAVLATATLDGLAPESLAVDILASATVATGGGDTGLTLGIQLRGADGPLLLSDLLGDGLPFDTELPAVGFAFSTVGLTGDQNALNDAEFGFLKTLYGCGPLDERAECPLTAADGGPLVDLPANSLIFLTNLPLPTPSALVSDDEPADIPADQQLSDMLWQFGVDVSRGVQVTGALSLDGAEASLTVDLPPITNDTGALPDWIDNATLSLAISLSPEEGLSVRIEGGLGVRLRQAELPIGTGDGPSLTDCTTAVSQGGLGGVSRVGFDQNGNGPSDYCYEVIPLTAGFELGVDAGGLKISGDIGLGDANSDYSWEAPFGLQWLEIRAIVLQVEVAIPPTGTPTINVGAFGAMKIFGKDVAGAGALGIRVIQATPFVLPDFKGFRIRSEAGIELNDLYGIYKFVAETADPTTDLPDHVSDLGLPNPALKNLDFGLAIENNDRICLQLGIIASADLYKSYEAPDPVPGPDRGACVPIGDAQPVPACHDVPEQCFASMFFSLSEAGLFATGSLSPFDLGPLHWDGGLVDLALSLEEQRFVLDGGVSIDGIGGGSIAILVEPTQAEFFGDLTIAGGFEAQVSGGAELLLPEIGEPFPRIGGTAHFDAAMRNDFEQDLRADLAARLREIADQVGEIEQLWNDFAADPLGTVAEVVDHLEAAGVPVPTWASELADQLADLDEEDYPSLTELFGQLDISFTVPALPGCPEGFFYDPIFGVCRNFEGDEVPSVGPTCPVGTLEGDLCRIGFSFTEIFPADLTEMIDEIAEPLATVLSNVDLVPSIPDELSPSAFIERLAEMVDQPALVEIDCAAFSIDVTIATDELSAQVAFALQLRLLGVDHALGFSFGIPALTPDTQLPGPNAAQISSFVTELLDAFLRQDTSTTLCAQEQPQPAWYTAATAGQEELDLTLSVDKAIIDEGDAVTLTGDFGTTTTDPVPITIDWGDSTVQSVVTTGSGFETQHTYTDDGPTAMPFDVQTIVAAIDEPGGATDTTAVTVRNVDPTVHVVVDATTPVEGDVVELIATISDPGADEHLLAVSWGDGDEELVAVPATGQVTLTHRYVDDDPSRTASDPAVIEVLVADDDGGEGTASQALTIFNADPTIPASTVTGFESALVEEGVATSFTVEFDDVGARDSHRVLVEWGDGTSSSRIVDAGAPRTLTFTHTYLDDDPSGTASDVYAATITVFDDDRGSVTADADVTVRNVDPVVTIDADPAPVQYSDPVDDVVIVATDVAGDPLTATTAWSVDGGVASAGLPGAWALTDDGCTVDSGLNETSCQWTFGGIADLAPGQYTIGVTVEDDDLGSTTVEIPVTVLPEDARAFYVGPVFAATTDALDNTAVVELRATVQDITLATDDPAWDPYPGDILNADVRFVDRENGDATLCTAELGYTFDGEIGLATAWCEWTADIGNSDAESFVVGVIVEGWYTRNQTDDDTVVTLARPLDQFITGGGFLDMLASAGVYEADSGSKANFGFNVKFNKRGTNLQGRVTVIVRADGRVYRIKTNSLTSLGVVDVNGDGTGVAEFEAKANIVDVTDEGSEISLGGNLTFQMRMTDNGEPGDADTIGFSLWNKDGELLFSSNWDDVQTLEQLLGGGNLVVHD